MKNIPIPTKTKPSNKITMVTTISGKKCNITDCKLIDDVYYKIGDVTIENSGDCYYMEETSKYVRITSELIIYDHTVKSYVYINNKSFQKGVVGIEKDGSLIIGNFTYKRLYLLPQLNDEKLGKLYCLNDLIFKNQNFYKEDLKDGIYYHKKDKKAYNFVKKAICTYDDKKNLSYSVDSDLIKTNTISHKEGFDYPLDRIVSELGGFINNYSFGLEFETINGFIPNRLCRKLGLIPLRDGSISGLEYVTIPLEGKLGLQTVLESVRELKKRTDYDNDCSLHLHIGNIPRTEKYFLSIYKLLFLLQDELYNMFPIYKKDNRGLKKNIILNLLILKML
jgi:hypothetical protein